MLKYRLISGITLIAVFSGISFWDSIISSILFLTITCFFLAFAILELSSLTGTLGFPGYPLQTILFGLLYFLATAMASTTAFNAHKFTVSLEDSLLLVFITVIILRVFLEGDLQKGISNFFISVGGFIFIVWSTSFLVKIYFWSEGDVKIGPNLFFYVVIITKCADIGGYTLGKLTAKLPKGNRKITPRISPKKSWEGLAGSILLSVLVSCLLVFLFKTKNPMLNWKLISYSNAIIFGFVFTLLGLVGDLSISVLKRAARVKDSGARIPGFGGVLDLLDSLLFVPAFFYCILQLY